MNVYKVYLNERVSDEQFPKLKRFFKREIVEENCENAHVSLAKHMMNNPKEENITYSIGK